MPYDLFKYTVSDGVVPTLLEVENTPHTIVRLEYWYEDKNGNCNQYTYSNSWGGSGDVIDTSNNNTVIGTFTVYVTPDALTLGISYNDNLATVDNGHVLAFKVTSAWPATAVYCGIKSIMIPRIGSTGTTNTKVDAVRMYGYISSTSIGHYPITQAPRVEGVTSYKLRMISIPETVDYTISLDQNGAFTVNATSQKEGAVGLKIIDINGKVLNDMTIGTLPKSYTTYQPADKLVFYYASTGAPAHTDDLAEACFVEWLSDRAVEITFNFYDADTLDPLDGVTLTLSRDYTFSGEVNTGQNFTIAIDSIVNYVATKEGYQEVSGTFSADVDKSIDVLLPKAEGGEEDSYGNPDSKYITILDKHTAKINEPITVKVRNTQKAWWNPFDPEWVEGAEIYVDGVPTGKKTIKPTTGNWLYDAIIGWTTPIVPYTTIQISDPREHYVYAKAGNEYSQAAKVTITSEEYDFKGGADSGTYPGTDPYDENGVCNFRLIYSPTSVKVGGSVTFKIVKVCSGHIIGTEKGMIHIDGQFVGNADPEFVYRFNDAGSHKVYAIVNTPTGTYQTAEGVVTVYENTNDFIKDDGQSSGISVTVNVYSADTKQPLAGILVQRLSGSQVVEQRKTDTSGSAILHPESGHTYNILVSDPSNHYMSQLKEGMSWSADDTLTFYLKPVGDLDGDNSTDSDITDELTHIEVRVDGFAEDGIALPPGKHRITVVDQNGKELADADIYVNGDKVGKTGGWFWGYFGAGLDYDLSEPGQYEIKAEYQSLTDTIFVNITSTVNSYMLIAYPQQPGLFGASFSDSAMVNSVKVQKGLKVHFEVCEVDPSKPMPEWKRVDNALIYINGNQTGVTKPVGGWFGFGAVPAYEHTFSEVGNYTAYAEYGDAKTQTMTVYVMEGEEGQGTAFGGVIGELFGQIAKAIPLTGIPMVDTILWAIIIIVGGIAIFGVVIRVIL